MPLIKKGVGVYRGARRTLFTDRRHHLILPEEGHFLYLSQQGPEHFSGGPASAGTPIAWETASALAGGLLCVEVLTVFVPVCR